MFIYADDCDGYGDNDENVDLSVINTPLCTRLVKNYHSLPFPLQISEEKCFWIYNY